MTNFFLKIQELFSKYFPWSRAFVEESCPGVELFNERHNDWGLALGDGNQARETCITQLSVHLELSPTNKIGLCY